MINALVQFSKRLPHQCIKDVCLYFNIVAMIIDEDTGWCLETEDAANFYWLGSNFSDRVADWYEKNPDRFKK